jgi:hypothetical protein
VWDNLFQTIIGCGIFTADLGLHMLIWLLNLRGINHLVLAVLVDLLVQEVVTILLNLSIGNSVLQRSNLLRVDTALTVNRDGSFLATSCFTTGLVSRTLSRLILLTRWSSLITSLEDLIQAISLQVNRWVLLRQRMRFLRWLAVSPRLNRLDEATFVLTALLVWWKLIFGYWALDDLLAAGALLLGVLVTTWLHVGGALCVTGHTWFGWGYHCVGCLWLVDDWDVGGRLGLVLALVSAGQHASYRDGHFLRSRLFLALVDAVQVWTRLLLSWDLSNVGALHCFLVTMRIVCGGTTLLSVGATAWNIIVEASDVPHALLQLRLAETVTWHSNQLIRPILLQLAYLATGHDNRAGKRQNVVLQKFILLHYQIRKHLTVVSKLLDGQGHWTHTSSQTVWWEKDTLALEMTQHIVKWDELDFPP